MISIAGLYQVYADFVLDVPALDLIGGEILGLLGHNGAGKSTLLKAIGGVLPGKRFARLEIDGREIPRVERAEALALITEDHPLYGWMTVNGYLGFVRGFFPTWDQRYCDHLLQQLAVPGDKKISDLSKGTRLKVALIGSLSHRPHLLLLDEPTSGLDVGSRSELLENLDLLRNEGTTIIFSSHIVDDLQSIATRIAILVKGELKLLQPTGSICSGWRAYLFATRPETSGNHVIRSDQGSFAVVLPREQTLDATLATGKHPLIEREPSLRELFLAVGSA
jgi:ABC-2 type transport system ATP-binding protein